VCFFLRFVFVALTNLPPPILDILDLGIQFRIVTLHRL